MVLNKLKIGKFFINRLSGRNKKVLKGISKIQFEVTNDCNLSCRICWRALRDEAVLVKNVSFDKFKLAIDKILNVFDIRELNTQGLGEPFLCPDILPILKYVKSEGLSVWLVTNGTLIDDHIAEKLVEIAVDKIRFSVDSADDRLYAAIKSGSSLDKITQNISKINTSKVKLNRKLPVIAFNSVVIKGALCGADKLIEMAASLSVKEISLIPLVVFSKSLAVKDEQVDFYDAGFNDRVRLLKELASQAGIELNLGISLESREDKFCHSGFYIDVDGLVHPCCNVSCRKFGNIYKENISSIVSEYLRFRKWLDGKRLSCKECNKVLDNRC